MSWSSVRFLSLMSGMLLSLGMPLDVSAQASLTVSAGPAGYDLSGDGWSGIAGIHLAPFGEGWARAEVGSGVFWYRTQGSQRVLMLLPEIGGALQAPSVFPMFLGVGVGYSLAVQGDQPNVFTAHAALGFSLAVNDEWRIRPEMRLRVVDPFHGTIGGFTLGVTKSLGG